MKAISSKEKKGLYTLFLVTLFTIVFESVFIDKLCLFIICIILVVLGNSEKKFVNPYFLFFAAPFSLLVYFNVAPNYMFDLEHTTYLIAIINIVAFITSFIITRKNAKEVNILKKRPVFFLKLNIFILFTLALLALVIKPLNAILWLFSIPAIVGCFKTKEKKMILLALAYIVSVSALYISKMQVLLYLITILLSLEKFYFKTSKQLIWVKVLAVLSIVLLVFSFSFANKDRGAYDAEDGYSYYYSQGAEWNYDVAFFLPYMYLTSAWTNLQFVMETQNYRTNGLWTIKPFIGYIGLDESYKASYELVPNSSFNTFTFVTVGFKDFGLWFSILPTIIIGFLSKRVYTRFLVSQSPFDISTYIVFALAISEMFFSNHFYMLSYPFTILILRWFYKKFVPYV